MVFKLSLVDTDGVIQMDTIEGFDIVDMVTKLLHNVNPIVTQMAIRQYINEREKGEIIND